MRFVSILILTISVALTSCNWGNPGKKDPAIAKDTLGYSYKSFKERAADCGDKPDSNCTVVKISYPQFDNQQVLNDSIARKLNTLFGDYKKPVTGLEQISKSFLSGYNDFRKDRPKSTLQFLLDANVKVLRQDSSITTLEITGYSYTGGAHGATYTTYVNWNSKANKSLKLEDVLVEGYIAKLNVAAEKQFRNEEKLSDTASLNNNRDYFFKSNKFSLPDSYLFTPTGISFLYNVYTIKPYAAGQTELVIPYAQIKSLIRPHTVLSQYIK